MTETLLSAPPARGGRPPSADWIAARAMLRAQPNAWKKIADDTLANVAGKIARGEITAFRLDADDPGHYEAVSRELTKESGWRRGAIWAAYVVETPERLDAQP